MQMKASSIHDYFGSGTLLVVDRVSKQGGKVIYTAIHDAIYIIPANCHLIIGNIHLFLEPI